MDIDPIKYIDSTVDFIVKYMGIVVMVQSCIIEYGKEIVLINTSNMIVFIYLITNS